MNFYVYCGAFTKLNRKVLTNYGLGLLIFKITEFLSSDVSFIPNREIGK